MCHRDHQDTRSPVQPSQDEGDLKPAAKMGVGNHPITPEGPQVNVSVTKIQHQTEKDKGFLLTQKFKTFTRIKKKSYVSKLKTATKGESVRKCFSKYLLQSNRKKSKSGTENPSTLGG